MGEMLFTLAMLILFGVFYYGAGEIDATRSVDPMGAAFVPKIVILVGGILCLAVLIMQIRRYLITAHRPALVFSRKTLILLGLLVVFLLVLEHVGFLVSAVGLFFALTLLLGNKSYARSAVTALVSAGVFVVLFGKVLSVPLPRGDGLFRIMSHWFF